MRVLLVASEMTPFIKTGGLADVLGMLPGAYAQENIVADAILPYYAAIKETFDAQPTGITFTINMAGRKMPAELLTYPLEYGGGQAFFIKNDEYYDRSGLYGDDEGDYQDNCERFIFFCRAAIEAAHHLKIPYDTIHCCDWQAGLVPVYHQVYSHGSDVLRNARSVFNIHNLAYQGVFWHWDWPLTGLDWALFNWQGLEYYGKINFMKGGIMFADATTVVSKTYAREIQTPEFGCGLDGVFRYRNDTLHGILTGLDYLRWDPAHSPELAANYGVKDLSGKRLCREALLQELQLTDRPGVPICCMTGDLQETKGIDLLLECLDDMMHIPVQIVVAGHGRKRIMEKLTAAAVQYAGNVSFCPDPDEPLLQRIYAGSDMCLVPSRFEPSGVSQLQGLRYGAVPLVSTTGGLADTIVDYTPEGVHAGESTGFIMLSHSAASLLEELEHACRCFATPDMWSIIMRNGMNQDFSFQCSASRYKELYAKVASV